MAKAIGGTKLSIGPVRSSPIRLEPVAHLEDERQDGEPDGGRDQRRDGRLEGDHDRAEGHREHEDRDADDVEQEPRRALVDAVADVDEGRVLAAHVGARLAAAERLRARCVAQRVDQVVRLRVLRRGGRRDHDEADVLRLVVDRLLHERRRRLRQLLRCQVDLCAGLLVRALLDDDRDRAVEAGAEARREQVVGLAAGRVLDAVLASAVPSRVPSTGTASRRSSTIAPISSAPEWRDGERAPATHQRASPAPPRSRRSRAGTAP